MMPTFRVTGDVVLVDKLSVKLRVCLSLPFSLLEVTIPQWYKRGDVVVSRSPSDAGQWVRFRLF